MIKVRKTVLLADDDPGSLCLMQNILEDEYELLVAKNGAIAFSLWQKNSQAIDLIVVDIQMPLLNGYDIKKAIRANAKGNNLPIIFLSSQDVVIDNFEDNLTFFMQKPIGIMPVKSLIRKLLGDATLLIVDDDESCREVAKIALENEFKLLVAVDGSSAIEIFREKEIDAVLLDIMMPNMSGFEVCQVIRNEEKGKMIPILFLTALSERENRIKGIESGGWYYLQKPFSEKHLKQMIVKSMLSPIPNRLNF